MMKPKIIRPQWGAGSRAYAEIPRAPDRLAQSPFRPETPKYTNSHNMMKTRIAGHCHNASKPPRVLARPLPPLKANQVGYICPATAAARQSPGSPPGSFPTQPQPRLWLHLPGGLLSPVCTLIDLGRSWDQHCRCPSGVYLFAAGILPRYRRWV